VNDRRLRTTAAKAAAAAPTAARCGFDDLALGGELAATIRAAGYAQPTPIQQQAIPHVLAGRDLLGCAQTGTGKTAAFALPILHRLMHAAPRPGRPIRALVLAPTRELAAQIGDSFRRYAPRGTLRCHVVFGGVGKGPQIQALRRGLDVLVATPGRLLDLMNEGRVDLRQVETFVLDEADRMLDMGFLPDVRRVTRALPRRRQTLLFSATLAAEIRTLAGGMLSDPVEVAVTPVSSTAEPIDQFVYFVDTARKTSLLIDLLRRGELDRVLVFTRTKHGANRLTQKLVRARIQADAIHGNKSQSARERALAGFRRGQTRVVVATDIAARGIDVKDLPHVVNFDLPHEPEVYVHRVGRTGRAGARGTAITLCAPGERGQLGAIERLVRRRLEILQTPDGLAPEPSRPAARSGPAYGGRSERRVRETAGGERTPRPRGRRRRGARRGVAAAR